MENKEFVIDGKRFASKNRFKLKEVRKIEELLVSEQSDAAIKALLSELLIPLDGGKIEDCDINEMYEEDFFQILGTFTSYKKKLNDLLAPEAK